MCWRTMKSDRVCLPPLASPSSNGWGLTLSGDRHQGILQLAHDPQLYVNKEFIGGCDILVSMHQSGELAELLEKEQVLAPPEETPEGGEKA